MVETKIRLFEPKDAKACETLFTANCSKYYGYLKDEERNAFMSINRADDFIRMATKENNRFFVIEKEGKIAGYVQIRKDGDSLKVKRTQLDASLGSFFFKNMMPFLEQQRVDMGCKEITAHLGTHLEHIIPRIPGVTNCGLTAKTIAGETLTFIKIKIKPIHRK